MKLIYAADIHGAFEQVKILKTKPDFLRVHQSFSSTDLTLPSMRLTAPSR